MRFVAWLMFGIALLIAAYGGYQYLYFTGAIEAPLPLPPAFAAQQPSHAEDYATTLIAGLVAASAVLAVMIISRQRAKSVRGFEVGGTRGRDSSEHRRLEG